MPLAPPLFVVAAAIINPEHNVLVQQRAPSTTMAGLWEFPGGKVEDGETPEHALARELEEELGVLVSLGSLSPVGFASEPLCDRHLILLLYSCFAWDGYPKPLTANALLWIKPAALSTLAMPPADIRLIEPLRAHLCSTVPNL
jgi:8-oxo-dGTP diphosphatase